ncbi:MAG TPA: dienelactone hydrolase family protein [Gemmatimonadales bacterium]|nr:dienelactone hydrolase family protein [Gemmatimonadales bacterium]
MTAGSRRIGAAATYVLVILLALLIGAAAVWSYSDEKTEPASAGGDTASVVAATGAAVTTHGEWVYIERGEDSIRAYVAYPERSTKAPAVIVIHEIFGLTDWEPTVADRLAKEGYVAILPDLLSSKHGISPADPDSGRKLVAQLEPERVTADLNAVYAYVNGLPAVAKDQIGTIGFCWGGGQSFRYATNNPKLRAVVVAYGPAPDTAAMKRIKAPVLGIYGENDERINAALPDVTAAMQSAGNTYTPEVYPGTGHGFLKPGRQGYDTPEREKAWTRILEFYRARLGR